MVETTVVTVQMKHYAEIKHVLQTNSSAIRDIVLKHHISVMKISIVLIVAMNRHIHVEIDRVLAVGNDVQTHISVYIAQAYVMDILTVLRQMMKRWIIVRRVILQEILNVVIIDV